MITRARAEYDVTTDGVRVALGGQAQGSTRLMRSWPQPSVVAVDAGAEPPPEAWLRLAEEDARAIYEALAQYFGFSGADGAQLRSDYMAERQRVDKMIDALIESRS